MNGRLRDGMKREFKSEFAREMSSSFQAKASHAIEFEREAGRELYRMRDQEDHRKAE
jgi:hypothetical protein